MVRKIYDFENGISLFYDYGYFDEWCVYISDKNKVIYKPKDKAVFERLLKYSLKYGIDEFYNFFIKIYNLTTKDLNNDVIKQIIELSEKYVEDKIGVSILFTLIYACMIAEENKEGTKLGKKIKRLGIHQVLKDGFSCEDAANFSKRKNSRLLNNICKTKGF